MNITIMALLSTTARQGASLLCKDRLPFRGGLSLDLI